MTDLPNLFEDDFAVIDPATDVTVRFINYLRHVEGEDRNEPGSGWFYMLPDADDWQGPFASEAQTGMEIHSELHGRETAAVAAAYEASGFERNRYFGRNAIFRSYHRRIGEETVVIAEEAERLTIYRIPDAHTTIVQAASIMVGDIRSPDFHVVDLVGDGKARTVRIDPQRHTGAVIGMPDIESTETYGHELAAAREAIQRTAEWEPIRTP
jgi:hypothetical protein